MHLAFQVMFFFFVLSKGEIKLTIFLVDLRKIDEMSFEFQLGTPFKPYEQLMGVLPVASMEHIPLAYQVRSCSPFPCPALSYPSSFRMQ